MAGSVNFNSSILATLAQLDRTGRGLETTQNRISTGLAVANAADNPSVFADAANGRSEIAGLRAAREGLDSAASLVNVAAAAGTQISNLLRELRALAISAQGPDLSQSQRDALSQQFQDRASIIDRVVASAQFNRINLLDNSEPGGVRFIADAAATTTILLQSEDFRLNGANISITTTTTIATVGDAAAAVDALDQSIARTSNALGRLGLTGSQIEAHQTFLLRLSDTLENAVGRLVDADLGAESARLSALQISQQLSAQALSIANSAPNAILSLFR